MNLALFGSDISSKVVDVKRNDSDDIKRIRVVFNNDYELSIVRGHGMYCNNSTYEVAVIKDGQLDYTHTNGDVLKYQSVNDIRELSALISSL